MNRIKNHVVIIPAYKPGNALVPFVEELGKYFTRIIVVDDGAEKNILRYLTIFLQCPFAP